MMVAPTIPFWEAFDFLVRTKDKYPHGDVVSHKFPLDQINERS